MNISLTFNISYFSLLQHLQLLYIHDWKFSEYFMELLNVFLNDASRALISRHYQLISQHLWVTYCCSYFIKRVNLKKFTNDERNLEKFP